MGLIVGVKNSFTAVISLLFYDNVISILASFTSAWLIVAVTVERLGAVSLPHKAKLLFTRGRSYVATAVISVFFVISNTRIFMTFDIVKIPIPNVEIISDEIFGLNNSMEEYNLTTNNICSPDKNQYLFPTKVWMWYDLASYNFLPFLIILVGNISIIILITKASSARKRMSSQGKFSHNDRLDSN